MLLLLITEHWKFASACSMNTDQPPVVRVNGEAETFLSSTKSPPVPWVRNWLMTMLLVAIAGDASTSNASTAPGKAQRRTDGARRGIRGTVLLDRQRDASRLTIRQSADSCRDLTK